MTNEAVTQEAVTNQAVTNQAVTNQAVTNQAQPEVWRIFLDPQWYSRSYADAPSDPELAALHFREHGLATGLVPGPMFDPTWYLQNYPDVAAAGMDPVAHFFAHGWLEVRIPSAEMGVALELVQARSQRSTVDLSDPLVLWAAAAGLWRVVMPTRHHESLSVDELWWYNVTLANDDSVGDRRAHETPS